MRVLAALVFALVVCSLCASAQAQEQSTGKTKARSSAHARKHASAAAGKGKTARAPAREHEAPKSDAAQKTEAEHEAPHVEQAEPAEGTAKPARAESGKKGVAPPPPIDQADVHSEGGTQVKTLEFSGLDIEGQLKTPQMLYFLNRLRAEFDRPQLPHRSFMPELQRSTQEKDF